MSAAVPVPDGYGELVVTVDAGTVLACQQCGGLVLRNLNALRQHDNHHARRPLAVDNPHTRTENSE